MRRFLIERDIPGAEKLDAGERRAASCRSNEALAKLAPDVQWVQSFIVDGGTVCEYLAKDEAVIRRHAELSGFPATRIREVRGTLDPTTGG